MILLILPQLVLRLASQVLKVCYPIHRGLGDQEKGIRRRRVRAMDPPSDG
jgi:hypothetical protein